MKTKESIHCIVLGKVQGVWFRANTQKKAHQLGVTGWVRNLPDGTVEVKATAEIQVLKNFIDWLHKGPELARVDHVIIETIAYEEFTSFELKN